LKCTVLGFLDLSLELLALSLEFSKNCEYCDRILLLRHPPLRLPDHLCDPEPLHLGLHSVS
jgi:hypothetical protein